MCYCVVGDEVSGDAGQDDSPDCDGDHGAPQGGATGHGPGFLCIGFPLSGTSN